MVNKVPGFLLPIREAVLCQCTIDRQLGNILGVVNRQPEPSIMADQIDSRKKKKCWPTVFPLLTIGTLFLGYSPTVASPTLSFQSNLLPSPNRYGSPARPLYEQKATPRTWLILLPFQNAPGPQPNVADTHNLDPGGAPDVPPRPEAHQSGTRFDRCLDADLCLLKVTNEQNNQEREVMVRLFGIDVPSLQGTCEQEKVLANAAVELLGKVLSEAAEIDLYDHYKVGSIHMSRVVADGQDLSQLLINQGLAVSYGSGQKNWCND